MRGRDQPHFQAERPFGRPKLIESLTTTRTFGRTHERPVKRSSPSILTSVPDHLPNSTRSPALSSEIDCRHRGRDHGRDQHQCTKRAAAEYDATDGQSKTEAEHQLDHEAGERELQRD